MSTEQQQEVQRLHIVMTGRPPVRIDPRQWPQVAQGQWGDNAPNPPNREWTIRVRQHTDGRSIVYGRYRTAWQGELDAHSGYLLEPGEDAAAAINRVGEDIGAPAHVAAECVADLPAEDL